MTSEPPPRNKLRRVASISLLTVYLAAMAVVTLTPSPVDKGYESTISRLLKLMHAPEWFGYAQLEFSANVAMFVPLGFLFGLAFARRARWFALIVSPVLSVIIELTQATLLPERYPTLSDVIANSLGGTIGVLIALFLRWLLRRRDANLVARELWESSQHEAALVR